jgi:hypothetical protein
LAAAPQRSQRSATVSSGRERVPGCTAVSLRLGTGWPRCRSLRRTAYAVRPPSLLLPTAVPVRSGTVDGSQQSHSCRRTAPLRVFPACAVTRVTCDRSPPSRRAHPGGGEGLRIQLTTGE